MNINASNFTGFLIAEDKADHKNKSNDAGTAGGRTSVACAFKNGQFIKSFQIVSGKHAKRVVDSPESTQNNRLNISGTGEMMADGIYKAPEISASNYINGDRGFLPGYVAMEAAQGSKAGSRAGIALHSVRSNDINNAETMGCGGFKREDWPEALKLAQEFNQSGNFHIVTNLIEGNQNNENQNNLASELTKKAQEKLMAGSTNSQTAQPSAPNAGQPSNNPLSEILKMIRLG